MRIEWSLAGGRTVTLCQSPNYTQAVSLASLVEIAGRRDEDPVIRGGEFRLSQENRDICSVINNT